MNLRDVFKNTCADFLAGNAVTWIGPPGFGKTDSVGKLTRWMLKTFPNETLGVATIFMATSSPISFTGLPWKGSLNVKWGEGENIVDHQYTITDPAIPTWYLARDLRTGQVRPANLFHRVLLVIEEWGQGDAETKRAGAELLLNGGAGKYYLPQGSFRLALSNNDKRDGITKEFDFCINRRGEYPITPDVDVWIEDFADVPYQYAGRTWNVMPVTKAWAKVNPQILFEKKPEQQGPWCTPRSMTMADRYAQVMAEMNGGDIPINDPGFQEGVAGKIGMAATTSYIGHLQFVIELPAYEDVVKDPTGTPVPSKADLQMLMAYELAGRTKTSDLGAVIQYMSRKEMPKDMSVTFVSSLVRRDYKSMIEQPAMQAWISKNASLVSLISSLSQA